MQFATTDLSKLFHLQVSLLWALRCNLVHKIFALLVEALTCLNTFNCLSPAPRPRPPAPFYCSLSNKKKARKLGRTKPVRQSGTERVPAQNRRRNVDAYIASRQKFEHVDLCSMDRYLSSDWQLKCLPSLEEHSSRSLVVKKKNLETSLLLCPNNKKIHGRNWAVLVCAF